MKNKHLHEIDWVEPLEAARVLSNGHRLAFLDSAVEQGPMTKWSYLAVDPFGVFQVRENVARWNDEVLKGNAISELRKVFSRYSVPLSIEGPPFQGGAIGVIYYEAASLFDDVPITTGAPQMDMAFYDCVLAFDREQRRLFVCGKTHETFAWPNQKPNFGPAAIVNEWHDSRTRLAYERQVAAVVEAVREGAIFQANLAHRFTGISSEYPDALATYQALRDGNPAPFSALLVNGSEFIACTSPERFLQLDGRQVETRPIKGTARRHVDPLIDAEQALHLKSSEKDRAENTMIVDLLRNDLSRVAIPDSVIVKQLCEIESYARLHHLVSIVTATLEPDIDWLDLLAACFPGGSITGAPKLKAMEVISAHEQAARGVYCGSIGWVGFDGSMDLNIAIRTLTASGRDLTLNAGGGITLLSNPAAEYEETLLKAEAVMSALAAGKDVKITAQNPSIKATVEAVSA
jgi:para-aminobenzoate synthetase component I